MTETYLTQKLFVPVELFHENILFWILESCIEDNERTFCSCPLKKWHAFRKVYFPIWDIISLCFKTADSGLPSS